MNMVSNSAPDRASPLPPALGLALRLDAILTPLRHLINARILILGVLLLPLHARITRASQRLVRLFNRLATGRYPAPRAARPNQPSGKPAIHFPSQHAWIVVKLGYQAAGYAAQLEHLLRDPEMLAVLAAAPPHAQAAAARTLRPLCHMLGIPLPPLLQPPTPTPKPKKPAPKKPGPEKPPRAPRLPRLTMRDCLPSRTPRDMPFLVPPFVYRPPKKIRPA